MDERKTSRYPSHGRAQVALPDGRIVGGHTLDLSPGGVAILLTDAVPAGFTYLLRFEVPINGSTHVVVAKSRLVYGVFAGSKGFRAGFAFAEADTQRSTIINRLASKLLGTSAGAARPAAQM